MNGRDLPDQGQIFATAGPLGGVKRHKDFPALIRAAIHLYEGGAAIG